METTQEKIKLDPIIKEKWVKALRSGEYHQGDGQLYNSAENTYCCLGILELVCGTPLEVMDDGGTGDKCYSSDLGDLANAPTEFRKAIGAGGYKTPAGILAEMNDGNAGDGKQYSFEEIALYIEENY